MKMTVSNYNENILSVINEIKVEDFSISNEVVEYILIEDTENNRLIIKTICTIAQSNFSIKDNTEDGCIDITSLGFEFGEWWSSSEGFEYKIK